MIAPGQSIDGTGYHRTLGPDEPSLVEIFKTRKDGKGSGVGKRRVEALAGIGDDHRDRGVSGFDACEN
jgi:hypothetical protein